MEDRSIVIFDCETTGTDTNTDRIVSIALMKADKDLNRLTDTFVQLFNPGIPIPKGASDIHGITDDMVKNMPLFKDKALGIAKFIGDSDLGTFNGNRFDIPLIIREFADAGIQFSVKDRRLLDAYSVFAEKEKRDLTAAVKFYCNKEMEGAHEARADVDATFEVLKGQIEKYDDVNNIDDIDILSGSETRVDTGGFMERTEEGIVFKIGKHKGKLVTKAHQEDSSYFTWLFKTANIETRDIITEILK